MTHLTDKQLTQYKALYAEHEELDSWIDTRGFRLTDKGQAAMENNPEPVDKHPKKNL